MCAIRPAGVQLALPRTKPEGVRMLPLIVCNGKSYKSTSLAFPMKRSHQALFSRRMDIFFTKRMFLLLKINSEEYSRFDPYQFGLDSPGV
jgi:hypothetical protein